jgi:hypothetical protein
LSICAPKFVSLVDRDTPHNTPFRPPARSPRAGLEASKVSQKAGVDNPHVPAASTSLEDAEFRLATSGTINVAPSANVSTRENEYTENQASR